MTTRTSVHANFVGDKIQRAIWSGLLNGDDGQTEHAAQYADRSVQVFGTFGAAGSVRIEGSNDGTNWSPLTDPQGNDLNITTAKIEQVMECTLFIRPKVTAGDGTTSLTVILVGRAN